MLHDLLIAGALMLAFDQPRPAPRPVPRPPVLRPARPAPVMVQPSPMPPPPAPPLPGEAVSRFVVCPADPRCRRHSRPIAPVPD